MKYLLLLMLLPCLACGQRIAIIGDSTSTGGSEEGPWDPGGGYGALLLSDRLSHTAGEGHEADSAFWYSWTSSSGTIDASVYMIDGADTTEIGSTTITISTTHQLYGADFNPNLTLTAGKTYYAAFGDTTGVIGSYLLSGAATANSRGASLASTWVSGDQNTTFSYQGYITIVSKKNIIEGATISGTTIH